MAQTKSKISLFLKRQLFSIKFLQAHLKTKIVDI